MGIRRSKQELLQTDLPINDALKRCDDALSRGGFKNIVKNETLRHLNGKYKKITVFGEIDISLKEIGGKTEINLKSTANVDNIFALFSSPNNKILKAFISNF